MKEELDRQMQEEEETAKMLDINAANIAAKNSGISLNAKFQGTVGKPPRMPESGVKGSGAGRVTMPTIMK